MLVCLIKAIIIKATLVGMLFNPVALFIVLLKGVVLSLYVY